MAATCSWKIMFSHCKDLSGLINNRIQLKIKCSFLYFLILWRPLVSIVLYYMYKPVISPQKVAQTLLFFIFFFNFLSSYLQFLWTNKYINFRNWDVNEFGSLTSKIAITNSERRNFEVEQNLVIFSNFKETKFQNILQILKQIKLEVIFKSNLIC